jgi:hypothetical protein
MRAKVGDETEQVRLWHFALGGRNVAVDLGHLVFVTALAGWCLWYLLDARSASTDFQNLALIEPVTILILLVWALIARRTIAVTPDPVPHMTTERMPLPMVFRLRIIGSMALLVLYVVVAAYVGFDVGTVLYIGAALYLLGERSPVALIALPLGFCLVAIFVFNTVLATPLPTFFGSLLFGDVR